MTFLVLYDKNSIWLQELSLEIFLILKTKIYLEELVQIRVVIGKFINGEFKVEIEKLKE